MTRWLFLACGVLATILGLFLAAGAHDPGIRVHGFMISGFGIALSFWMVHRWPLAVAEPGAAAQVAPPAPVVGDARAAERRELVEPA
jgi:uncharacterized membrane protein YccC